MASGHRGSTLVRQACAGSRPSICPARATRLRQTSRCRPAGHAAMPDAMLHPEFETLAARDVRRLQERLWSEQWRYVRATSALYRAKLDRRLPAELDLDGLERLPFTDKEELRASQERCYPFGDYVACGEDRIVRLHRTSGTTGRPLQLANSRRDVAIVARIGGRAMFAAGVR